MGGGGFVRTSVGRHFLIGSHNVLLFFFVCVFFLSFGSLCLFCLEARILCSSQATYGFKKNEE